MRFLILIDNVVVAVFGSALINEYEAKLYELTKKAIGTNSVVLGKCVRGERWRVGDKYKWEASS